MKVPKSLASLSRLSRTVPAALVALSLLSLATSPASAASASATPTVVAIVPAYSATGEAVNTYLNTALPNTSLVLTPSMYDTNQSVPIYPTVILVVGFSPKASAQVVREARAGAPTSPIMVVSTPTPTQAVTAVSDIVNGFSGYVPVTVGSGSQPYTFPEPLFLAGTATAQSVEWDSLKYGGSLVNGWPTTGAIAQAVTVGIVVGYSPQAAAGIVARARGYNEVPIISVFAPAKTSAVHLTQILSSVVTGFYPTSTTSTTSSN